MADQYDEQAQKITDLMRSGRVDNVADAMRVLAQEAAAAEATEAEREVAEAREALRAGGQPPGEEPQMPAGEQMLATYRYAKDHGANTEAAQRAALQTLFDRAAQGDPTACYGLPGENAQQSKERWAQQQASLRGVPYDARKIQERSIWRPEL